MSRSTSLGSSQTAARKKQKIKHWSSGLVKSAAALEDLLTDPTLQTAELLTRPALLRVALKDIRLDNSLELQGFKSWVDQELEQLHARVRTKSDSDVAAELAKVILIPKLEAIKKAIVTFNMSPPLPEAIHPSQPDVSPSGFAKDWHKYQTERKTDAHLCLRPPELKGLPLELLHPAFATFRQTLADPYPPKNVDRTVLQATNAAIELCAVMGCYYNDERDRGLAFAATLDPFFERGKWMGEYYLPDSSHSRRYAGLDGAYYDDSKIRLLREDKSDAPTEEQEAYMQLVHGYRWAVSRTVNQESSHQKNGAPMLLFLVKGTEFLVAGAVFNGVAVVAEPL
ncbi:hypothetical protein FRC15_006749, partial [Serendipita sp. 397]